MQFSHLHVHTQYSLLDGASSIKQLFDKAEKDKMPALAITDHGNMFGVFRFVAEAHKRTITLTDNTKVPAVKPIIGCEFYLVEDRRVQSFVKPKKDIRYHQLLLAKNENGYRNLIKLCSLGYAEGMYSKYPRIDKELILAHHSDIIATTCCLGAKVPRMILEQSEEEAEKEFLWWLDIFGEDYYIELQRHDLEKQNQVNEVLLKWSKKHQVKVIATNDVHYVEKDDSTIHDILLCVNTGEKLSTPKYIDTMNIDEVTRKNTRFAFPNDSFFMKTTQEMEEIFKDIPEALDNTNEIVSKIDILNLQRDVLLPDFPIPTNFQSQFAYLQHLTYQGAKKHYPEITEDIKHRLQYELEIIQKMGYSGYFLIVLDFITAARKMNVVVGPGRGSAAGSIVAYCLGITTIDPIKYGLLFERFLNPDRKTLPDIDVDFDDEGRKKVIDYIVEKYGINQVAQIVNYGTMRSRNSIRDVARVVDLDLQNSNLLSNLVPQKQTISITLDRIIHAPLEGQNSLKEIEGLAKDELDNVKRLREFHDNKNSLHSKVLENAIRLEGSVRNVGIHAAGIIIAPKNLLDIIPLCKSKETDLWVTQIEGKDIENAGVIKMDILSIKTLTYIKNAQDLIRQYENPDFEIDKIPLDDQKTYELFQKGNTIGVFQFESGGMQKHLKELKPDKFEYLIAMNALYRPGPMAYIPSFINRKFGREKVKYDLPIMKDILEETYGITVYQEQVMLLAQKIASFSRGDSDMLRKAMGKKDIKTLNKMKSHFIEGAKKNNYDEKIINKIWADWVAFASYAFNKSHSTVYALIAYQTAYLKANFPHTFFTALLNINRDDVSKITFFTNEAIKYGIDILGPNVNESAVGFSLTNKKIIRYGLDAIKGIGKNVCENIIEERKANGEFKNLSDMLLRLDKKVVNKKSLESLAYAGALDCFTEIHRAQYFSVQKQQGSTDLIGIEKIIKDFNYLCKKKEKDTQPNLFVTEEKEQAEDNSNKWVTIEDCEKWTLMEQLKHEKRVTGAYLSGHPLDNFKFEFKYFDITTIQHINTFIESTEEIKEIPTGTFKIAGIVSKATHRISSKGTQYAQFALEDYSGIINLGLFKEQYLEFKRFIEDDTYIVIEISLRKFVNATQLSPRIHKIYLLEDMREKMCKKLTLTLQPDEVDENMIHILKKALQKPEGNTFLKLAIFDNKYNQCIDLINTKQTIHIDEDLANFLINQDRMIVHIN